MGVGRSRSWALALVVASAAGACGLFPDVSTLESDASTVVDVISEPTPTNDASGDVVTKTDGSTDASTPFLDACPDTGRGPTMARIDPTTCIDTTEAKVSDYKAFLADLDGGLPPQIAVCAWNTTMIPLNGVPGSGKNAFPISNINWCQAQEFCAWSGKSLCGGSDGGAIGSASFDNPDASEWMNACTAHNAQSFPYGTTYKPGECNLQVDVDASQAPAAVATFPKCIGGVTGLFDMVGNIKEWENACALVGGDGSGDICRRRGSGFDELDTNQSRCDWDETDTRDHQSWTSGVRCCAQVQ